MFIQVKYHEIASRYALYDSSFNSHIVYELKALKTFLSCS